MEGALTPVEYLELPGEQMKRDGEKKSLCHSTRSSSIRVAVNTLNTIKKKEEVNR